MLNTDMACDRAMLTSPPLYVGFQHLFELGGAPASGENPGTDGRLQNSWKLPVSFNKI